jgi:hypothetical protein
MTMRYYTGSSTAIPPSPDEAGPAIDAVNDSNNEEGSLSSATTMEPQPTSKSAMLSPMERLERARQRARKLNMERFMV